MALLGFTGFETGALSALWDSTNGSPTVTSGSARSGTGTYYGSCTNTAWFGFSDTSLLAGPNWDPSTDTLYVGFAMRLTHGSGTSDISFGQNSAFNQQFYWTLTFETNGAVNLYHADSLAGTDSLVGTSSSGVIANDTWHYVEVHFWPDNTSGRLKLVVDGMVPSAASGSMDFTGDTQIDTTRAAAPCECRFRAGSSATLLIDDAYWCDDTASGSDPYTTLMGEQTVEAIVPTSDSSTAWTRSTGTTNYETVDEIPPSETDYVETTTATNEDIYGLGNTALSGTANAVSTWIRAWQNTVTTGQVRTEVNSSGSTTNGATHNLTGSGTDYVDYFAVDPNAGGAWSNSAVDAATVSIYCVAVT